MNKLNEFIIVFACLLTPALGHGATLQQPDFLKGIVKKDKLHIEFRWDKAPKLPPGVAVEFEFHICPKAFTAPNWDEAGPGKDYSASGYGVQSNLPGKTYVDPMNYSKPATVDEAWKYVKATCKWSSLFPEWKVKDEFYNAFEPDQEGNFALGLYDGDLLESGIVYYIDLPVQPIAGSASGAYAWIRAQVSPRTCKFANSTWEVSDCPYFIGAPKKVTLGIEAVDCGQSTESIWALDICAPTEYRSFGLPNLGGSASCKSETTPCRTLTDGGSTCKTAICQDQDADGAIAGGTFKPGSAWFMQGSYVGDCVDDPKNPLAKAVGLGSYLLSAGNCQTCAKDDNCPTSQICTYSGYCGKCALKETSCADSYDDDCNKCTDKEDKACGGCNGKQCGTTKCGQSCGSCTSPGKCNESTGQCEQCQPNCSGKNCGPDGCGKMCGTCTGVCNEGKCCTPNCTGTVCGDNGCGQPCGECPGGTKCNADGTCPKDTGACKEWNFAANWSTLGWFVPANQGKDKGNVKPNGDWLVSPSTKDPQIDVKNVAIDGAKCNRLVAAMSTNCKYNQACIYFRTKKKVTKSDGTEIDCTKLGEDHKVCGPTCATNTIWCDAKFDLSQDLCWTKGGDIVEIRFDYVDSMGQGPECPVDKTGDAGFSHIKLYHWGGECAEGTPPEACYSAGPTSGIKGACSAGLRLCEQGTWSPCVGEVKPKNEVCDGLDNDCDGQTDEDEDAQMCTSFFVDNDGDGYGSFSKCLCAKSGKYQADSGGDCDDNNAQVNPGKNEQCNNIDDNCVGGIDEGPIPACDDGFACTSDSCSAGKCANQLQGGQCKIGGACQASGTLQPGMPCSACDPSVSTSFWSPSSGAACDDNNSCTKNDTCTNGKCAGTGTCDECQADADCKDDGDLCNGTATCDLTVSPTKCKPNSKGAVACKGQVDACKAEACNPASGKCELKNAPDGTECDADGSACTKNDACKSGTCTAGPKLTCSDENPCTDNSCDPKSGCVVANNSSPCTDNDICTEGESCASGKCSGGSKTPCADGNPCTDDNCDKAKGCLFPSAANGTLCGQAKCVGLDYIAASTCANGQCIAAAAKSCNDNNGCTGDACSVSAGCSHLPNVDPCEDGSACTVGDKCLMGTCQAGTAKACADGNPCTADNCDKAKGCVFPAAADGTKCMSASCDGFTFLAASACAAGKCVQGQQPVSCEDKNACTDDSCDPGKGCVHVTNTAPCDDQNACTVGDACGGGACKPGETMTCNDGKLCTDDTCAKSTGCVFTPNVKPCDDGDACTTEDACIAGKCNGGKLITCDDKSPCTLDGCSPTTGCTVKAGNDNAGCDDLNACTSGDKCSSGACQAGSALPCSDGNLCTTDTCDKAKGCAFPPAPDGVKCGNSLCDGTGFTAAATCTKGSCIAQTMTPCDDKNPCTDDTCTPDTGCTHVANTAPCDDKNPCTAGDSCTAGACKGGKAVTCNDGNLCTDDACQNLAGCVYTANSKPCDDSSPCTAGDACSKGNCAPGTLVQCDDKNPCTADSCAPQSGCTAKAGNDGAVCDDLNACTTSDKCLAGTCKGSGKDCSDGNPCTVDKCNPASQGCYTEAAADGLPCTQPSCASGTQWQPSATCKAGTCATAPAVVPCDDNNSCTVDSCNSLAGCQHNATVQCSDNNGCTDDKCDPKSGCVAVPNSAACDDGNACTLSDGCSKGLCAGLAVGCDDGNACTTDSCSVSSGCFHVSATGPCDADGITCTLDTCANGKCQPGALPKENCCNGVDDNCDGAIDECGVPVQVDYVSPSQPDAMATLVRQLGAGGSWANAVTLSAPAVKGAFKACPGNGVVKFNLGWKTPMQGRLWACDSDTAGGVESVGQLPVVTVAGVPASVMLVPGSGDRSCDFGFAVNSGNAPDNIVSLPGKLLVNSQYLGGAACAILVGDHAAWLAGPIAMKAADGFYHFDLPAGHLPAGIWRFNIAVPSEGCASGAKIGTTVDGAAAVPLGPWANWTIPGMSEVAKAWAYEGPVLYWGSVEYHKAWRMLVAPNGVTLPAGNQSTLATALAHCKVGALRDCPTDETCGLVQTCLDHPWPFEAYAGKDVTAWKGSSWSICSPQTSKLPIPAGLSDACGGGDADCDGVDPICGNMVLDPEFDKFGIDGTWGFWPGEGVGAKSALDAGHAVHGTASASVNVPAAQKSQTVSIYQLNLPVVAGKRYLLSFWAGSDKPRTVVVAVELNVKPFTGAGLLARVDVTAGMRRYEIPFTATATGPRQLDFQFSEASGTAWIDSVTMAPLPN